MTEKSKKYDNTLVINLFAGPGAGKSTAAAGIFSKLKWAGVDCELLVEYAKSLHWEGSFNKLQDQIYVFSKQLHGINILMNKVEVIVTDSPILLSIVYGRKRNMSKNFENLVLEEWNKLDTINYYIERKKRYNPNGRSQNEEEARMLDEDIVSILNELKVVHQKVEGKEDTVDSIVDEVLVELGRQVRV